MVAKISIGSSLYGALSYNNEKINEAKGRILAANKVNIPISGKVKIPRMVEDFKSFMPKMGRTKKPVLHISLNPHPDDKLTDQDFEILAREYLDKLGFGAQPWVMYKHEDIDRHHIHIVTVNVTEEGKRLDQSFLFQRSKKITTELEAKYGLHKAQREKVSPDSPINKVDPSGDIKRQVANVVKLVGMRWKFQSIGEYNAILSLYNIRCEATDGKVNGREYHGLVYHATDDYGNTIANPFKASRLGKFASRAAVEGRYERAAEQVDVKSTRKAVANAMYHAADTEDFTSKLREKNIELVLRHTDDGRLYGVTFLDHNTQTALNGSRLGKPFSANALHEWFLNPSVKPELHPVAHQHSSSETESAPSEPRHSHTSQTESQNRESNEYYHDPLAYQPSLPGLDLFQVGPGYDAEQEAMNRELARRKKKKRRGPKL